MLSRKPEALHQRFTKNFGEKTVANHKSSLKRIRQTKARAERNISVRTRVKSAVRKFREAISRGDKEGGLETLRTATRVLRKAGSKGLYHRSTVSRRVSRLERAFNAL